MERDLLDISDGLLNGRLSIEDHFPVSMTTGSRALELADGLAFVESFANVTAVVGGGQLAIIDAGSPMHSHGIHDVVRAWTEIPLSHAVYTHGHVDHCFGVPAFEAEQGAAPVEVVAHEAVSSRFDRYRMTLGYNGIINQRQFRLGAPLFPEEFRYPDRTYRDSTTVTLGDLHLELYHDKGETDDHTWVWIPGHRALCTGDLFIWVAPNCGNPQKVQRYPIEWAAALRKMQDLGAEILLPGHGLPIQGATQVCQVLGDTAELLESVSAQTLELMNAGAGLNDIVHSVTPPHGLLDRPWLQPVYDDPEFIVHNVWRLYGGWYDGDPSHLKPAPAGQLAGEIARLAGGIDVLTARATELAAAGDLRLAGHLAEFAAQAGPDNPAAHGVRAEVNRERVATETSLMAKGIFGWAEHESAQLSEGRTGGEPR
jgi:glyoxylase-like metal-dependent hydrolase (beta-lactamase superfamily II)